MSTCPLGHGSVGAGPFPGYVHGKHPEICKHGCKPDIALDKYGRTDETPLETLVREAIEYQELYQRERGSEAAKAKRVKEILAEIDTTGTYTHTYDELQHGARLAWRNAPKCSNRKFWEELNLLDYRHADSAEGMYLACLDLLEVATLSCVTTANIAVFRAQTPGTEDGPRVWNTQLIRFAGYAQPDGSVLGEKAEAAFTTMCEEELGWKPPPPEKRTRFDMLPLVLQPHPDEEPKLFALPPQYVARVPITHPEYPQLTDLGLQWYSVPAVSCLELSVGGLTYTGIPFNGWYAVTEIVRNLTEEGRYDQCPAVAAKLGLDTRTDVNMWRDQCIVVITQAIMHSFREAGYGMVDHHTLMRNFWGWYHKEKDRRGYVPGNWKWIIPPVSPTASPCYLQLNHMTEYTLKPGYWYAPMWRAYLARLKARRAQRTEAAAGAAAAPEPAAGAAHAAAAAVDADDAKSGHAHVFIAYASVTGTTAKYAEAVAAVMSGPVRVTIKNMEDFEPDSWQDVIRSAAIVVLMLSTYGPGAPPSTANKLIGWLQKGLALGGDAREALTGKPFGVLGMGCTSYPRFCAAADQLQALVAAAGAEPLMPVRKVDSLSHEEVSVWGWVRDFMNKAQGKALVGPDEVADVLGRVPMSEDGKPKPFKPSLLLIDLAGVDGVRPAQDRFRKEATIIEVRDLLNAPASGDTDMVTKAVKMDVTSLPGGGLTYMAGDELAVWGENPPEVVDAVAEALGVKSKLDSMFLLQRLGDSKEGYEDSTGLACVPFPLPNSYRTVLQRYIALCDVPSFEAMRALAVYAPQDPRLKQLGESYNAYQDWVTSTGTRWCDMWREFPLLGGLPLAVFFQLAPTIKSRHYSISSSAAHVPGELHLTVSRLAYKLASGATRAGFCSSFLASCTPGAKVSVKVLPTPGFRMPLDPAAPVIMVAAGTGLAPFKSFWEERLARNATAAETAVQQKLGPGVLIFGCRNSTHDYIYSDTIMSAKDAGALSKVITAFSREPRAKKQYVQDVVAGHGEELAPLLRDKATHVYVCGSSNMAQEVAMAFRNLVGAKEFGELVQAGRYHEDVFGMIVPDHRAARKAAAAKGAVSLLAAASPAEVAELLDGGGLALDAVDHSGSTLLHGAVRANNTPLVELLLARGVPLNVLDVYGCTALQLAKLAGHSELVPLLEGAGAKLSSRMVEQFFPLHKAVMEGDLATVKELIASGADLGATEFHGLTPLHVACAVGSEEVITTLIDAGAPLDLTSRRGLLPRQLALGLQRTEAVRLLEAAGAPLVVKQIVTAGENTGAGAAAWDPSSAASAGFTDEEFAALQGSWAYLSGSAFPESSKQVLEDFSVQFFLALFDQCPQLLALFPFKDANGKPILEELKVHGAKVFSMVGTVVALFSNFPVLARATEDLVERHIGYAVELAHYSVLFDLLSRVVSQALGPERWDGATKSAWTKMGNLVCAVAKAVYERHEAKDAAPDAAATAAAENHL